MIELHIDRLAVRLPGFSEADGRRLALLVADGLAKAEVPDGDAAAGMNASGTRVEVEAAPGQSLARLAERIVAEVLRQLA